MSRMDGKKTHTHRLNIAHSSHSWCFRYQLEKLLYAAASEGADGEVRGSRSSLVRMRDVDPPEVPLRQAPYNPPQDVASNSGSLVQVAEQAHPLVQRCPSPNPMREHRNNRTHEEVVVGGGATPHG